MNAVITDADKGDTYKSIYHCIIFCVNSHRNNATSLTTVTGVNISQDSTKGKG